MLENVGVRATQPAPFAAALKVREVASPLTATDQLAVLKLVFFVKLATPAQSLRAFPFDACQPTVSELTAVLLSRAILPIPYTKLVVCPSFGAV